jgi:Ca-activated chloride channel family protein
LDQVYRSGKWLGKLARNDFVIGRKRNQFLLINPTSESPPFHPLQATKRRKMMRMPNASSIPVFLLGVSLVLLSACSNHNQVAEETSEVAVKPIPKSKMVPPGKAINSTQTTAPSAARLLEKKMVTADSYNYRGSRQMPSPELLNREKYQHIDANPVQRVAEHPVSTFSIDVDTGSYANVRRMLQQGRLPPADAVRVEEMVNYFDYHYPGPADHRTPFKVTTEIAPTPWNQNTRLLRIGIKGYEVPKNRIPPTNLVFLVDVSGSMQAPNKLELLKTSLKLLVRQLKRHDHVSLVVYAGASGVVLEPTPGNQRARIIAALSRLRAGGSTNGEAGIKLAYDMAEQGFIHNGINRVILATDGDFNVGVANVEALKNLIEEKRKSGISLTTLGFGMGNYNDQMMEQLADTGNGNYAYIDNLNEANKVLVQQISSTLFTIAKDVKVQIEFNPSVVSEYRLVGYENRKLRREDFNNDKIDAGEIGAGHTVTALYEITLAGQSTRIDPLRYGNNGQKKFSHASELAFLRMRYKAPGNTKSRLLEWPIERREALTRIEHAGSEFRFAMAVAGFAELLRGGKHTGAFNYEDVLSLARNSRGRDTYGYRGEFIKLVNLAESLSTPESSNRKQTIIQLR